MVQDTVYGIIGGGALGQAFSATLRRSGKGVEIWDRNAAKCTAESLQELATISTVIIICTPSEGVRGVLSSLRPYLDAKHIILTAAKGVEKGFITMDRVLAEELGSSNNFGILYGPMLAGELTANERGYGVLASNVSLPEVIRDFGDGGLLLTASEELAGVASCGVLKNIYGLGLGVADGIGAGINTKAALTVCILSELRLVLHQLQLPQELAYQYCGLGDLLATGWSENSYNHEVGKEIGGGTTTGLGGEGLNSLMEISSVLEISNFPIINCLHHIIINKAPAEQLNDIIRP